MVDLIHKIVSKTIGYDLVETKPMTEEENKKFREENEIRKSTWASLCGREWTINLKDRKVTLTALN